MSVVRRYGVWVALFGDCGLLGGSRLLFHLSSDVCCTAFELIIPIRVGSVRSGRIDDISIQAHVRNSRVLRVVIGLRVRISSLVEAFNRSADILLFVLDFLLLLLLSKVNCVVMLNNLLLCQFLVMMLLSRRFHDLLHARLGNLSILMNVIVRSGREVRVRGPLIIDFLGPLTSLLLSNILGLVGMLINDNGLNA